MMFEVFSREIRGKRKYDLESALLFSQDTDLVCNIHYIATKAFLWSQRIGLWLFISQYCYWPHVIYQVQCWLTKNITHSNSITFSGKTALHSYFFFIRCWLHSVLQVHKVLFFLLSSTIEQFYVKMLSTDCLKTDGSQNILWRLSHL